MKLGNIARSLILSACARGSKPAQPDHGCQGCKEDAKSEKDTEC